MKVITKMTGLRLLEEIVNNNLSCGTIIRHKREDVALMSNPPQPVYEYYKYTAGDKRFHRCNENGKLGAKGQPSFMNYQTLYKEFEIIEEDKEIEEIEIHYHSDLEEYVASTLTNNNWYIETFDSKYDEMIMYKINELIRALNELKKGK